VLDGEDLPRARPHREALHVPVPEGPDGHVAGARIGPQHLAGQGLRVLRVGAERVVAGADQQRTVGREAQPATAVPTRALVDRDVADQRVVGPGGPAPVGSDRPGDDRDRRPTAAGDALAAVQPPVRREVRVQFEAHQPRLALREEIAEVGLDLLHRAVGQDGGEAAGPLVDQHRAVGRLDGVPDVVQPVGHHGDVERRRCGRRQRHRCRRPRVVVGPRRVTRAAGRQDGAEGDAQGDGTPAGARTSTHAPSITVRGRPRGVSRVR
jgi:hypothetical protein